MKISGFTFCKNADSLYYPIVESIKSALPIVDEYIVALGESNDQTKKLIESIDSPKIKIIDTQWDMNRFTRGTIHAQQTDFAKSHCSGDWLLYLQADELIHEKDHETIVNACHEHLDNSNIEGFLFDYLHFWGDYNHYQDSHSWYDKEIRIIRNKPDIHSWQSAQSFRSIPAFDGLSYRNKEGTRKLNVAETGLYIYHYGWVRPPEIMTKKINKLYEIHTGYKKRVHQDFQWGDLNKIKEYHGKHPEVMKYRIAQLTWEVGQGEEPPFMRHKRFSSRVLTFIENKLFRGKKLFGYHNYRIVLKLK